MAATSLPPAPHANPWHAIVRRTINDHQIEITLDDARVFRLHRFALAGKKDRVRVGPGGMVTVHVPRVKDDAVVVSPAWQTTHTVTVSRQQLTVSVKEIETPEELTGYQALVQHHYRNGAGATRRALLVAKTDATNLPPVVGFVELCSSFLVNVPRKRLLDAPFHDSQRGIDWVRWDMDTAKKYTNATVRISRCVVYPELRGVGVAGILTQAAKRFALERWHIGGLRPSFLEITAEMLRYWPFVERAGFVKIGETEGNGNRVEQAITYLLQRKREKRGFPRGGGGILTMYRAHATLLEDMMKSHGWTLKEAITRIKASPDELPAKDWVALHAVYRRPKPVYMLGLTRSAELHVRNRVSTPARPLVPDRSSQKEDPWCLAVNDINIVASATADKSLESRQIQEAFNIVAEQFETITTDGLDLCLRGGEIVLVTGASGNGKSLLLRTVAWYASGKKKKWAPTSGISTQAKTVGAAVKVGTMVVPRRRQSPISLIMKRGLSLTESMQVLASAGLGEAQLFVRPSSTLSTGQRYRLSLALALAAKPRLLIVDEFCECLDEYSAAAVCRRLRREVERRNIGALVATTAGDRVVSELRPERILHLLPNGWHRWEAANEAYSKGH